MAFSGGGPSNPQITVTPLIDVLLVLIIMFMVVVSMSKENGLEAQIPQPAQSSQQPEVVRTIVIQIAWGGKEQPPVLKVNQDNVSWNDLHERLQNIYKQRAEKVAFVRGDDDVDFEYVADVIDIARVAGVDRVGLLGKQQ